MEVLCKLLAKGLTNKTIHDIMHAGAWWGEAFLCNRGEFAPLQTLNGFYEGHSILVNDKLSELFLQLHKPPILIDEVQYAPELFTYIKILVDKNGNPGDFWLTGSQVFKLMRGIQESLAGRIAILSLTSLSQAEINGGKSSPFILDLNLLSARKSEREEADTVTIFKRIFTGSMPAIVSSKRTNSQIFYRSYLK